MSNSLKDALLGLGFKAAPEPPRPPKAPRPEPRPAASARADAARPRRDERARPGARPGQPAPRRAPQDRAAAARPEFDLGKAYALRAQKEKDERIAAEAAKQEEARIRREARAKLAPLLEGKALNDPAAEHVRHFEYGGKIKRVHVTSAQLVALNAGELGVVQAEGRYLLVDAATLAQVKQVFAPAIALEVDPNAPAAEDPYSDPAYQVPDDLIW